MSNSNGPSAFRKFVKNNNLQLFKKLEYEEVPDQYDVQQGDVNSSSDSSVMIKIDVGIPNREENRFPKEKWKTLIAFIILGVNFFIATFVLALVHDRVPDRDKYGPLPDIVLDNVTANDWALSVSEVQIMVVTNICILLVIFHKHRFIVARRIFLLMSLLYLMRSITMYVTVLPMSSTTYYCSPKSNSTTITTALSRAIHLISGFGLSINGKQVYCGDFMYSGHTVILVLGYLIISEYSPKYFWILHWTAWINALVGVCMVLLAHGHYTIDIIVAYYVTTRLFWTYHTLANNSLLLKANGYNLLAREWWFCYFKYFEQNVKGPLPHAYEWPFSLPRRFLHAKLPNHRES
ncbi:phosphatidylcholine:ceramide cholinephosphotransferase 2-like isoform X2 [Culicoides brevitarsis]|uniref:phosphatidylcholine:ceramide cholinephosphotransferase 2-like isoform X2 n=1 Tax=Culicoides brevitarsis TaxID=469753 RepID=UPI00307C56CF